MSAISKTNSNVAKLLARNISTLTIGLATQTLLMRNYSLSEWGQFVYFLSIFQLLAALTPNTETLLPRFSPEHQESDETQAEKKLIKYATHKKLRIALLTLAATLTWGAICPLFGEHTPAFYPMLACIIVSIPLKALIQDLLVSKGLSGQAAIVAMGIAIAQFCTATIAILLNTDLNVYAFAYAIADISISAIIAQRIKIWHIAFSDQVPMPPPAQAKVYSEHLRPLYKSNLIFNAYTHGTKIIVGSLLNKESVAIYNLSKLIIDSLMNVFYALPAALMPNLVRNPGQRNEILWRPYIFTTIAGGVCVIAVHIFGENALSHIGGSGYLNAKTILDILSTQLLFRFPSNITTLHLLATSNTTILYYTNIAKIFIDGLTGYALTQNLGIQGMATSNVIGYVISSLAVIELSRKGMKWPLSKTYLPILIVSLITSAVLSIS